MKKRKAPGELELSIAGQLQKLKTATVADICESFNGEYAYTTVLTVLSRMHVKGMVQRTKLKKQYHYTLTKEKKINSLIERVKKSLFGGKTSAMVHYLIETSDQISKEELQKLEQLIKKYKQ
ncbi:MAG: hypothetical protein S4CHLAM6_14030 [Chlamydiae bacterium]|nr:hypothetical protein [Chlamydiota bacterium]